MMNPIKKRNNLLKKLSQFPEFVRGSITSVCSTCNRAQCICLKKSSLVAYRLTYKDSQQKTRSVYVKKDQLPRMQKMIANYALLKELIEDLIDANIEVFKNESR
ncbi:MAG: hypothetical protein JXI43_02250 [Tissierellales bacterium]|nr:hypothetical protein [Tissierellales bacterium]